VQFIVLTEEQTLMVFETEAISRRKFPNLNSRFTICSKLSFVGIVCKVRTIEVLGIGKEDTPVVQVEKPY
jgi:hypothetical protein